MNTGAIAGVIVTGVITVGGAGGYGIYNWRRYLLRLKDKRLAVLGQSKSGKTTFFKALKAIASKNVTWRASDEAYAATEIKTRVDSISSCKRHYFYLLSDVPGNTQSAGESWQQVLTKADYVFYCFDAHELKNNNKYPFDDIYYSYSELIQADIIYIKSICNNKPIILLGTHSDLLKDLPKDANKSEIANYKDNYKEQYIRPLNLKTSMIFALGSLLNYQSADLLIGSALEDLISLDK